MTTLLLATRNAHKVAEIRALLPTQLRVLTLNDFPGAPSVKEDAPTFAGNAAKKAVQLARWLSGFQPLTSNSQLPSFVLADDSGLEVDALAGAPGVISARFAASNPHSEGNASDADNNAKLLRLLRNFPMEERTARFRCVLAWVPVLQPVTETASPVCAADEFELHAEFFDGTCEGRIGFGPRGESGFGYDPLFLPVGRDQTFAELGEEAKNKISHRSQALAKLRHRLVTLIQD